MRQLKKEQQDKDDIKLVHFTIVDASQDDIKAFAEQLNKIKLKLPYKIEFIVTNERVELVSLKYLLKELYELYKKTKEDKK